ncbi:unnamed protein product [Urochloa decumbens]|uniref:KIB1-4 beta-propeller domain-containing protein n=1 Tax=Urochloa decumbens TaxID=240449 RepID=A0ABC9FSA3_9POAL
MDPLDPSLAPLLLFGPAHGGAEAREEKTAAADDAMFVYSIPKRQLLPPAAGLGFLNSNNVQWITPQGWVLTLDPSTRDAALRDPFTSHTVCLPQDRESLLPTTTEDTRCLLSTRQPTGPGCVVLVIHLKCPVLWHCSIPAEGSGGGISSSWSRHEYPHELIAGDRGIAMWVVGMLTAARGKFYTCVFADDYKLLTLELSPAAGPVFSTAARAVPTPWLPGCFRVRVVESCEDLYAVRFSLDPVRGREVEDIYVYKLVMSSAENAWVKVDELGDGRVFFLGKGDFGASMAADGELGLEANCIYFTNENDKGLYVYDMKQGSIILHNPGPDIPDSTEPMLLMHQWR